MPIVDMRDMLDHAYQNQYAVGSFDLVSLDFLEGILDSAEKSQAPVILSLAESHFQFFNFDTIMAAVENAAQRASVPVAIHLDHGSSLDSAIRAINRGCNGVMIDASHKPLEGNIKETAEVVRMAHSCGIAVEGELGYVPGEEGEDAENHPGDIIYTSVEDAQRYVEHTGVDFLAVSIGTVHGRMSGTPQLDFNRLAQINSALNMPLVIHGGTGLSNEQFQKLVENGVSKINYYSALADVAGIQIRQNARENSQNSYTSLTKDIRQAISAEVENCIRTWGSANRAQEVLESCKPWLPVEHLIVYNVKGSDEQQTHTMISEGKRILSEIPGVREVVTGEAVKEDAQYRYTWLVRFCHPAVIDSYRDHPSHVAFADNQFRPVAGDRISIDYRQM